MYNVALSPNFAQDQTIFMATNQLSIKMGVYALMKSADGGVTWYVVQGMPSTAPIVVIAFSPGIRHGSDDFLRPETAASPRALTRDRRGLYCRPTP